MLSLLTIVLLLRIEGIFLDLLCLLTNHHCGEVNLKALLVLDQGLFVLENIVLQSIDVDCLSGVKHKLTDLRPFFFVFSGRMRVSKVQGETTLLALRFEQPYIEIGAFTDFIVTVFETLLEQEEDGGFEVGDFVCEGGKGSDTGSSDHCLLQVHSVVDKSDVGGRILCLGTFFSQEVNYLGLNVGVFAVLNMFSQDHQSIFSLGGTNLDDGIHNALSELNIAFLLQTVCQELQ